MSPKSRGRKSRRPPHHRPHQPRRERAREARQTIPAELMSVMLRTGKEILGSEGPLDAETVTSGLLGSWWGHELIDADFEEVIGEGLVAEATRRRTPESLALLKCVAALAEGRLSIRAATGAATLEELGVAVPGWLDHVGQAQLLDCWRSWDATGDATSVYLRYAYADEPPHVLTVLVDRNLGELAKDVWAAGPAEEILAMVRAECARLGELYLEQIESSVARDIVDRALAVNDRALRHDPPISDEARSFRALARARLRKIPEPVRMVSPDSHDHIRELGAAMEGPYSYPEDRPFGGEEWVIERDLFLAAPEVKAIGRPRLVQGVVQAILDYGEIYDDGRILRVSPTKVEMLLMDWLPNWSGLRRTQLALVPEVLPLWCRFAADRSGLPTSALADTLATADRFIQGFAERSEKGEAGLPALLLEHVAPVDVWDRAEQVERMTFALPAEPETWMLGPDEETLEDDFIEMAASAHPEYDGLAPEDDYSDAEVNPRLHLAMHAMASQQLWHNEPPEVWLTARRLMLGGYDQHEIHHMLANAAAEPMRRAVMNQERFDHDLFLQRLAQLPASWEAQRPAH